MAQKIILGNFYSGSVIDQRASVYSIALQGYAWLHIHSYQCKRKQEKLSCNIVYISLSNLCVNPHIRTYAYMTIHKIIKSPLFYRLLIDIVVPPKIHYYYSSAFKTEHAYFVYILSVAFIQLNTLLNS